MPNNNVGGVSVSVRLDDKDALAQLAKLRQKIQQTNDTLGQKRAQRDSITEEMEKAEVSAEKARQRVEKLKDALSAAAPGAKTGIRDKLAAANADLREQASGLDRMNRQWQKLNDEIEAGERNLAGMATQSENLENQIIASGGSMAQLRSAVSRATESMRRSFQRLGRMITKVFWFSVILRGLRAIREYLGDMLLSFPEIRASLADIKGNLLTAMAPIITNVLLPALRTLLNLLVNISAVLADIAAKIFGTTASAAQDSAKALQEQADGYKEVGGAAKQAGKQLAAFDQLNILNEDKSSGAGASGSGNGISPAFDTDFAGIIGGKLAAIELLVGEALLALGAILAFSGANIPLGIALMALGAMSIAAALREDWDALRKQMTGPINTILMALSGALLILGAILAFSGANIPLGIALMALGAAGLATEIALKWDLLAKRVKGPLAAIMVLASLAVLALGVILVVSGANLPLGIALIAAGAAGLAMTAALNWQAVVEKVRGPLGLIMALAGLATLALGVILVTSGANLPLGIGLIVVGAASLATAVALNWQLLTEKVRGPLGAILAIASLAVLALGVILTASGANLPLGIGLMIAGAAGLATVAALNWEKIKNKVGGPIGAISLLAAAAMLALGVILTASGANLPLGIALIAAGAAGLVTVADLNWDSIVDKCKGVWDKIKSWWDREVAPVFTRKWWDDTFSVIGDSWGGINLPPKVFNPYVEQQGSNSPYMRIPLLAQGAVIPPNRQFMAILGDQRNGTNIEAPLDTIVQAFRVAMDEGGTGGGAVVQLYLDGEKVAENTIQHINRGARAGGRLNLT